MLARERILIIDGAMETEIQVLKLNKAQFRGQRFAESGCNQNGNNDLLILLQPEAVEEIHFHHAMAGADILGTNTFSSTSIA
jgi:5-methyltetrahydrofolate--homocysteine methyltransferase